MEILIFSNKTDLTGETMSSYNQNGMVAGDTRISITMARNKYNVQFDRNTRLLVDDYDSGSVLAYRITKPFKIGGVYNGKGAMRFVLTEVNSEDTDNFDLHIADYYKHFPDDKNPVNAPPGALETESGKRVWF